VIGGPFQGVLEAIYVWTAMLRLIRPMDHSPGIFYGILLRYRMLEHIKNIDTRIKVVVNWFDSIKQ